MITESRRNWSALLLGAVGGFVFACSAWGYDFAQLLIAHVIVPWAKFVPGLLASAISGALCAFFASKSGKLGIVMLIWIAWGCFVTWIAGLIPVYLLEWLTIQLHPKLAGVIHYPVINLEVRLFLTLLVMFGLTLIYSFLFQNVLDAFVVNLRPITTSLTVGVWLLFFIIFGASIDTVYNLPLRRAATLTHEKIQIAAAHVEELDQGKEALKLGILSMRPMKSVLQQPYWIAIKGYDETLEQVKVMVDFSGYWFTCEVSPTTIYVCK